VAVAQSPRARRIPESKRELYTLLDSLYRMVEPLEPVFRKGLPAGSLVFRRGPRVEHLVHTVRETTCNKLVVYGFESARLRAVRVVGNEVEVKVEVEGRTLTFHYDPPVEAGLSLLFHPSVLSEYTSGNVDVDGDSEFKDFIDVVVTYGPLAMEDPASELVDVPTGGVHDWTHIVLVREYPGLTFEYVALEYNVYSKETHILFYDGGLDVVESFPLPVSMYRVLLKTPGFRGLLEFAQRLPRVLEEFKRLLKTAYLGVKSYEG